MIQNLNKNWFVVCKMTWEIWQIFTRTLESVKIGIFMGLFCLMKRFFSDKIVKCADSEQCVDEFSIEIWWNYVIYSLLGEIFVICPWFSLVSIRLSGFCFLARLIFWKWFQLNLLVLMVKLMKLKCTVVILICYFISFYFTFTRWKI